jgi:hypothetical protein
LFSTCANPRCLTAFDYRQGVLVRFPNTSSYGSTIQTSRSIQHFWLCGRCSEVYKLRYREQDGVFLISKNGFASAARVLDMSSHAADLFMQGREKQTLKVVTNLSGEGLIAHDESTAIAELEWLFALSSAFQVSQRPERVGFNTQQPKMVQPGLVVQSKKQNAA